MVCKLSTSRELENLTGLHTYGRLELENIIERSKIKTLTIKMASILIENVKKNVKYTNNGYINVSDN